MNDMLKPMDNSEDAFANDSNVVNEPIKPIEHSEAFVPVEEQNITFENKEPEDTGKLSEHIREEKKEETVEVNEDGDVIVEETIEEVVSSEQSNPVVQEPTEDKPKDIDPPKQDILLNRDPISAAQFGGKKAEKQKVKINFKAVAIVTILLIVGYLGGKFGLDYYYTHDSNESVVDKVSFSDETKVIEVFGLNFTVPTNLIVENWIEYFTIGDASTDYVVRVEIHEADFEEVYSNYTHLKADTTATYNGTPKIESFDDKEYVVVESAKWFSKELHAFTKGNKEKMVVMTIINKKNTYDHKLLEKISEIINTVEDAKK